MRREYEMLAQAHGWDAEVFRDLNKTAARAAFCNEDTRATILKRLESE
jgi:adenosine deaminase